MDGAARAATLSNLRSSGVARASDRAVVAVPKACRLAAIDSAYYTGRLSGAFRPLPRVMVPETFPPAADFEADIIKDLRPGERRLHTATMLVQKGPNEKNGQTTTLSATLPVFSS
jgi:hypothetical protein